MVGAELATGSTRVLEFDKADALLIERAEKAPWYLRGFAAEYPALTVLSIAGAAIALLARPYGSHRRTWWHLVLVLGALALDAPTTVAMVVPGDRLSFEVAGYRAGANVALALCIAAATAVAGIRAGMRRRRRG